MPIVTSKSTSKTIIKKATSNFANSQGFTLMETIIAVIIAVIIVSGIAILCTRTVKNGKFVEKLSDTDILLSQKTTELFNHSAIETAKIPKDQSRAGSINPEQPVDGYSDLLNESGCVIGNGIKVSPLPAIEPTKDTTKVSSTGNSTRGKLGDLGSDTGDLAIGNGLGCATAFKNPSQSTIPKFRRQWAVVKDFPGVGDVTLSVVIVAIQTNQIVSSNIITKIDGLTIK